MMLTFVSVITSTFHLVLTTEAKYYIFDTHKNAHMLRSAFTYTVSVHSQINQYMCGNSNNKIVYEEYFPRNRGRMAFYYFSAIP